jgi:hypothetical protein
VETVLHQVLEAQVPEHSGAQPYERSVERTAHRLRTLTTRGGPSYSMSPTCEPEVAVLDVSTLFRTQNLIGF